MKIKNLFLLGCIFFFGVSQVQADDIIAKGSVLTLDQCIQIGLKNHPDIVAFTNNVKVYEARIGEAKSAYYPQLSLLSSYSRTKPTPPSVSPVYELYSAGLQLSQNIYDFGKTSSRVKIQNLSLGAASSDLENISNQVVLGVRQSYYGVLKAERDRAVAADSVRMFEQHLAQAKAFLDAGKKPRFDVTKAEVDLSNARLELIKAENNLRVARVVLSGSMGVPYAREYSIVDTLGFQKYYVTLDESVTRAYLARPDLKSLVAQKQAALEAIRLARRQYLPDLSGNATYQQANEDFPLKEGWNFGVVLTLPIFNGFETKHRVEEAVAAEAVLRANEESLRQAIVLEVQQSYLNLKEVEDSIVTAELAVKQAKENLDIAKGRYDAGVGNPIEVTDAQVIYVDARKNYTETLYEYQIARDSLRNAMGLR